MDLASQGWENPTDRTQLQSYEVIEEEKNAILNIYLFKTLGTSEHMQSCPIQGMHALFLTVSVLKVLRISKSATIIPALLVLCRPRWAGPSTNGFLHSACSLACQMDVRSCWQTTWEVTDRRIGGKFLRTTCILGMRVLLMGKGAAEATPPVMWQTDVIWCWLGEHCLPRPHYILHCLCQCFFGEFSHDHFGT